MRSSPSEADRQLLTRLTDEGLPVSLAQLERWRERGLLPRAQVVRMRFGGSRVPEHPEYVYEVARILAETSGRGRPWQHCALVLFDEGVQISTPALRGAAKYLLERQLVGFRRAWSLAEAGAESTTTDQDGWVADIATEAARYGGRTLQRIVREEIVAVHPHMSSRQLKEATERAVIWRIADIGAPQYLTDTQRNLARHGRDGPLDPLRYDPVPLPSERAACVETLTWPEASLCREELLLKVLPEFQETYLLHFVTWRVTVWRLIENMSHPERPIPEKSLYEFSNEVQRRVLEQAKAEEGMAGRE